MARPKVPHGVESELRLCHAARLAGSGLKQEPDMVAEIDAADDVSRYPFAAIGQNRRPLRPR